MTGVVSPLLYYAGIEDNQRKVKEYMLASIERVNKKQKTDDKLTNNKILSYQNSAVEC